MNVVFGIFFFLLGTIIGSFLNVVIYRYNTGMGIGGRSQCFSCGKTLRWYELVPVFSYIFLRGKCSKCKSSVAIQYPLVELVTGLLFLYIYIRYAAYIMTYQFSVIAMLLELIVISVLVVIFVYDMRHKIIPDGLAFVFAVCALVYASIDPFTGFHMPSIWALAAGPIAAFPFAFLWLISGGRWIGLGDAKLALGIGWMLGIIGGISAIIFSFWIGAPLSIMYILIQRIRLPRNTEQLTMKSEIPFAPFLILGFLIVLFFSLSLPGLEGFMYIINEV
ncbi:MAG: prepilin peptidase [Patescibacteria group bacterium]